MEEAIMQTPQFIKGMRQLRRRGALSNCHGWVIAL